MGTMMELYECATPCKPSFCCWRPRYPLARALAHDSWISRGLFRNANGEFCCGQVDCFVIPKERVVMTGEGYVIIQGSLAGMGPVQHEAIPFSEAQPSPDGEFWRCRRPDGSRRCFFAPTPLM